MSEISFDNYVAQLALFVGSAYKRNRVIYDTDNIRVAVKAITEAEEVSDQLVISLVNAAQKYGVVSFQDYRGMCYVLPGNAPTKGKAINEAFGGPWGPKVSATSPIKERMGAAAQSGPSFKYENGHRVWSV